MTRAVPPLLTLVLLSTGCASLYETADHPAAIDPVPIEAPPQRVYEAAVALAFDRGYRIRFTSEENWLIELERLDRALFGPPTVRRLDLLVRERGGQTYLHARYYSFEPPDPAAIEIEDEDRRMAHAFVEALRERLADGHAVER